MVALSTQEAHPNKASVRTFIQTLIATLVLIVPFVPMVVDIVLDEFGKAGVEPPGWLYAALTGAAVACALVAAIITRIMAIPGVNSWLKKLGIGSEPRMGFAQGGVVGPPADGVVRPADPDDFPKH